MKAFTLVLFATLTATALEGCAVAQQQSKMPEAQQPSTTEQPTKIRTGSIGNARFLVRVEREPDGSWEMYTGKYADVFKEVYDQEKVRTRLRDPDIKRLLTRTGTAAASKPDGSISIPYSLVPMGVDTFYPEPEGDGFSVEYTNGSWNSRGKMKC